MHVWTEIDSYKRDVPSGVRPYISVGVFDGVHLGHQALLAELVETAYNANTLPIALTFDIHPETFTSEEPPTLLNYPGEKIARMRTLGLFGIYVIKFDKKLYETEPEMFIRDYLVGNLEIGGIVFGYDSRFGKDGKGDFELALRLGEELGFVVSKTPPLQSENTIISSTEIRDALRLGNAELAARLLGYNYELMGTVVRGKGEGGPVLGYPTANLNISAKLVPAYGVYAAFVRIIGGDGEAISRPAFLNIGVRPTFNDGLGPSVEAHIFDFDGDLVGKTLRVEFVGRIRDEIRFDGINQLRQQLKSDENAARSLLTNHYPNPYIVY